MAVLIEPGALVESCGIDDEGVVAVPVARRVSVISRIRRALGVYVRRKLSTVHPYLAPDALLLKHDEHAVLPGLKNHSSPAAYRVV